MFPQFGATAETLSKASTMVFRFGTDAHLYDDPEDVNIAPLLDSRFDTEKYQALKRLLALIAQGFDVSNFFPQVVKNVASQSLEVKKLVYLYLLHYAERRQNEALLSINCFQKDLGDTNPLVRAWALRAMAGIRLHVISPLMLVALAKCARDPSVYVRKCAANALPKLNDLRQEENASAIEEIVGILLSDHSPGVVGSAAAAFASVCPNNLPLIGRNYRRLCEVLTDVEEWGQIALIRILLHYAIARHGLVKDSIMFPTVAAESQQEEAVSIDDKTVSNEDDFEVENMICKSEVANIVSRSFIEGPDEYLSHSSFKNKGPPCLELACFVSGESNEDIKILLQCTSPLLWSRNSAVVLAAAGVHWIMGPVKALKIIARPLLFLLRSSNASKYVVLCNIRVFAKAMPPLFATYYEDFFVCSLDSYQIKALKLEILSSIATKSSIAYILQEFQEYIRDPDRRFAADTVAAIGLCAQKLTEVTDTCLEGLFALMMQESLNSDFASDDGKGQVLIQAIISIKAMIKIDPPRHEMVIIQLVRSLDSIKVSAARAMIIWIIGQYNSSGPIIQRILTTVLHYLAHCFTLEAMETKLQILNTTVKILLCAKGDDFVSYKRVLTYVIELAKCDMHYDIRDRARMVEKFLLRHLDSEFFGNETISQPQDRDLQETLSKCIFGTVTKLPPPDSTNNRFYLPGSLSQIVLHAAPGYEPLPKPCSLPAVTLSKCSEASYRTKDSLEETVKNGEDESEFSDESSSQHSITTDYSGTGGSDETVSASEGSNNDSPLIMMADNKALKQQNDSDSLGDLMLPRKTLESWLDEQPGLLSLDSSQESQIQRSARISIGNFAGSVKPRTYSLLNPENSHGLRVDCSFSSEISSLSPQLVCVELSFKNCSAELISKIALVEEESDRGAGSFSESGSSSFHCEAVAGLEPGQTARRIVQVHFHHHLLPLKLVLWCDGKKLPLKLRPDIGYFVRPFLMDVVAFEDTESRLRGMFECTRRCTFTDHMEELNNVSSEGTQAKDMFVIISTRLALKMACNSNVSLVSVDLPVGADLDDASGLRLRFSSEMLQNSAPCLITITVEGKCIEPLDLFVKINCEEAVFGLNLLNGIVNFLVDTSLNNLK